MNCRSIQKTSRAQYRSTKNSTAGMPSCEMFARSKTFRPVPSVMCAVSRTLLGIDCCLISVGPGRAETIMLKNPFR